MVDRVINKTILRVRRGHPGDAARFDQFEVPFEDGMSVLDALRWIRIHRDSTLAIRYSCINANACKTCMALVDGEVQYTCIAKLLPGIVTVEPLPKRRLIRDLVTDIVPDDEKAPASRSKRNRQTA
jgi:succinate dehydrogenase/fumarate reductase-like Fe-S protein